MLTSLPDYMAPAYYAFLERMPLTTNGKIDRSKLPEPEKLEGVSGSMAAPENDIEQKLADAWQEVLGLTAVGVEDNFFDIGGHSLKAITLVARLKQNASSIRRHLRVSDDSAARSPYRIPAEPSAGEAGAHTRTVCRSSGRGSACRGRSSPPLSQRY